MLRIHDPLPFERDPRLCLVLALAETEVQIGSVLDAVRDHHLEQELEGIRGGSGTLAVAEPLARDLDGFGVNGDDLLWPKPFFDELLAQQRGPVQCLLSPAREVRSENRSVGL